MYFLRLTKLKPSVEKIAEEAWTDFHLAGQDVRKVERVLDVKQGMLCWVAGTIYMEMPLKPNILDDISKDVSFVSCVFWVEVEVGREGRGRGERGGERWMCADGVLCCSIGYLRRRRDRNTSLLQEKISSCWKTNQEGYD